MICLGFFNTPYICMGLGKDPSGGQIPKDAIMEWNTSWDEPCSSLPEKQHGQIHICHNPGSTPLLS